MKKQVRLTKRRAQEILRKAFCIKNAELERDDHIPAPFDLYCCTKGDLTFFLQNVRAYGRDLYEVRVSAEMAGTLWMYFDPVTLEHDYEAEDSARQEIRREICENCGKT